MPYAESASIPTSEALTSSSVTTGRLRPAGFRWYTLRVRHNSEFVASQELRVRGFECLVPAQLKIRQWSDRKVTLLSPLFPGYVFCSFDERKAGAVLSVPSVCSAVSFGEKLWPIEDSEMEALELIMKNEMPMSCHAKFLRGRVVRVIKGPLAGVRGYIHEHKKDVFMITLGPLEQMICVDLSWALLEAQDGVSIADDRAPQTEGICRNFGEDLS